MRFMWISEQTAIIPLWSINWSVFITEAESVFCAVRAGSLNQTDSASSLKATPSPDAIAKGGRGQQASRGHRPRWPSRLNESRSDQPSAFRLPWPRFSVIFLSCKANARVYDAKSGHGPHSPPPGAAASPKCMKKSQTCSLRLGQPGLRTQTANQAKFIPPIISPVPPRH